MMQHSFWHLLHDLRIKITVPKQKKLRYDKSGLNLRLSILRCQTLYFVSNHHNGRLCTDEIKRLSFLITFLENYRLNGEITHGARQAKVSKSSSEAEKHLDMEGGAQMLLWAESYPLEIHILKSQTQYLRMKQGLKIRTSTRWLS